MYDSGIGSSQIGSGLGAKDGVLSGPGDEEVYMGNERREAYARRFRPVLVAIL
jgi:hypothetical protein